MRRWAFDWIQLQTLGYHAIEEDWRAAWRAGDVCFTGLISCCQAGLPFSLRSFRDSWDILWATPQLLRGKCGQQRLQGAQQLLSDNNFTAVMGTNVDAFPATYMQHYAQGPYVRGLAMRAA